MSKIKRNILIVSVIIINLGVDQVSKILARLYLKGQGSIRVISDFFILTYAENTGAFLSMGSNLPQPWKTLVLVLFPAIAIILATLYLIFGKKVSFRQAMAIACIIGGGIGNVFDRAVHGGAVTDFLFFDTGIWILRTGVLNIADLSITFGAIALIIFQHLEEKRDRAIQENSTDN